MEYYTIEVNINDVTKKYHVFPNFTDGRDNRYDVFCDDIFICVLWFEEDITGIVWRADHKILRQETVDLLGEGIESCDL
jgi:hypothetical protein